MSHNRLQISIIAVVVLGSVIFGLFFLLQRGSASPILQEEEYGFSVKFVCGISEEDFVEARLAQGIYHTAININAPFGGGGNLVKWAVEALPEEQDPGRQTEQREEDVDEFGAFEIDCREIWEWLEVEPGTFHKGFVYLRAVDWAPAVVAIYTVQSLETHAVSIDVESVEGYSLPR